MFSSYIVSFLYTFMNSFSSFETQFNLNKSKVKLATVVKGDQKAPFSPGCRGGHYSFPWMAPLYP